MTIMGSQNVGDALTRFDSVSARGWREVKPPRMRDSFVYLGAYAVANGWLYVKCGKADNPWSRASSIGTSLPGGLTRMLAVRVPASTAMISEAKLLNAVSDIPGVKSVGGEWFRVPLMLVEEVVTTLGEVGPDRFKVEPRAPKQFTRRLLEPKHVERVINRREAREQIQQEGV